MDDNPVFLVVMIAIGGYVAWLWWIDFKAATSAGPQMDRGLPGAAPAPAKALWIAGAGAAIILAAETWGEIALGLADQQSEMTVLFGLHTLLAAIVEELIFRGYIVVERRGRALFYLGIFGASLLFALMHPFLWKWDDDGFRIMLDAKGWFSFVAVFFSSLWFYTCRFFPWNPSHSLLPCFVAHLTKNLGVFAIKAVQGFVVGLW